MAGPDPEADVRRLPLITADLAAVDAAMGRLDDGTYGTCEVCGDPLDAGRLAEQPALARCPTHT